MSTPVLKALRDPNVKMDSDVCIQWKKTHANCRGCPSEKTCKEYAKRAIEVTEFIVNSLYRGKTK